MSRACMPAQSLPPCVRPSATTSSSTSRSSSRPTWRRSSPSREEVSDEPVAGQGSNAVEGPGLLEQVSGAEDDLQARLAAQPPLREAVEAQDLGVAAADDEQRGGSDACQHVAGEVGASAARDDRANALRALGGRDERGGRACAGPEAADWQAPEAGGQIADR